MEANEKLTAEVAGKIEELLKTNSMALQTYIQPAMELGVIKSFEGRVRLVPTSPQKDEEKPTA